MKSSSSVGDKGEEEDGQMVFKYVALVLYLQLDNKYH